MKRFYLVTFSLFVVNFTLAQEFPNTEHFNSYSKFGFNLQYTNTFFKNEPNAGITIEYDNISAPALGFTYNFFQYKNFNFKVNTNIRFYAHIENVFLSKEESRLEFDDQFSIKEFDFLDILTRIKSEYYFYSTKTVSLNFGLGVSSIFYQKDQSYGPGFYGLNNKIYYTYDWRTGNRSLYFGGLFSLGADIKAKGMLLQFFAEYNHNFSGAMDIYTYTTSNLEISPDSVAEKRNTGHYFSFGLALHPKKGWLRKKEN
jgi:hypothetical protein